MLPLSDVKRPVETRRQPVLAAWGITAEGKKVLLRLMAGSKEDAETVNAFFQSLPSRRRGTCAPEA